MPNGAKLFFEETAEREGGEERGVCTVKIDGHGG
jgi:hypothetical protein